MVQFYNWQALELSSNHSMVKDYSGIILQWLSNNSHKSDGRKPILYPGFQLYGIPASIDYPERAPYNELLIHRLQRIFLLFFLHNAKLG